MSRAVFIDRDGTLNVEVNYLRHPRQLRLLPHAAAAVRLLNQAGYRVIVVTNQSGIAQGYFSEARLHQINRLMLQRLKRRGARIDAVYYCPHHADFGARIYRKRCRCRKPAPGMLLRAARDFKINLKKSFMVGDQPKDILAGKRAGCRTVLVLTGKGKSLEAFPDLKPDRIAANLREAARWILTTK